VSLGTVQNALRLLEQEGLVVTRHGSGTYVTSVAPSPSEIISFFFAQDDSPLPLPLYTKVLDVAVTAKRGPWSKFLGSSNQFIRIQRIINANLEFQAYAELYLRRAQFGKMVQVPKHTLDGAALNRMMFDTYHLPPTRFTYQVWAAVPPVRIASHIGVHARRACLHWNIMAHTYRDSPLFYQRVYIPETQRRLQFNVFPMTRRPRSSPV
jgi:GntR family transcriptional regulator